MPHASTLSNDEVLPTAFICEVRFVLRKAMIICVNNYFRAYVIKKKRRLFGGRRYF
jgi:hypothetical protein